MPIITHKLSKSYLDASEAYLHSMGFSAPKDG